MLPEGAFFMPKNMYRISVHIRNGGNFMFNKRKRIPGYVFIVAFLALVISAAIAFLCPIPDKFRQLVFWGLVVAGTIIGALIAAKRSGKGM